MIENGWQTKVYFKEENSQTFFYSAFNYVMHIAEKWPNIL